ncbi:MAG: translocation/assembly module TamB domain-containing protein [Candidatus Omnitrophota bacterium]
MVSKRTIIFFIIVVATAIVVAGGVIYYIIYTTTGSNAVTLSFLSKYVETGNINIKKTTGNLSEALVYQGIEFREIKGLPKGSALIIQRLEITLNSFGIEGVSIAIHNGQLRCPGAGTVLFYGDYRDGILNITVYAKTIRVRPVLDLFSDNAALKKISGTLADTDITVTGSLFEPEIYGTFVIEKLSREGFFVTACPGEVKLQLKDIKDNLKITGQVVLKSGTISGPKTADIYLEESKILFVDDPQRPVLDFKGVATVEKIKITIALRGTFAQPELNVMSVPPMSRDRLLLMLITNKTWRSVEAAANKQELSPDIARDFLDYFIFSGSGNAIAEKYGIRDISVKYDKSSTGLGATKDITDKAAISYSIEQPQQKNDNMTAAHKIGAEYKITENISVGAKKELIQNGTALQTSDKQQTDDSVVVKFKKEF